MDKKIHTLVNVVLTGRCKGVVDGGVADQMMHEVEIECLPLEVPEQIELDITELTFGDSVTVGELQPPAGVRILNEAERVVVSVHAPRVLKVSEGGGAEPEVVGAKPAAGAKAAAKPAAAKPAAAAAKPAAKKK